MSTRKLPHANFALDKPQFACTHERLFEKSRQIHDRCVACIGGRFTLFSSVTLTDFPSSAIYIKKKKVVYCPSLIGHANINITLLFLFYFLSFLVLFFLFPFQFFSDIFLLHVVHSFLYLCYLYAYQQEGHTMRRTTKSRLQV